MVRPCTPAGVPVAAAGEVGPVVAGEADDAQGKHERGGRGTNDDGGGSAGVRNTTEDGGGSVAAAAAVGDGNSARAAEGSTLGRGRVSGVELRDLRSSTAQ